MYRLFFVFLILSIMPRLKHFQALPDIFQVICSIRIRLLIWKQDNWVITSLAINS